MNSLPRTIITALTCAFLTLAAHAQWNFQHSFSEVTDPLADDYLFTLDNAEIATDPFTLQDRYLRPIANHIDGLVTYRFDLGAEITAAYLTARLNTEWSGTTSAQGGIGSIWGSKDGANWQLLLNVPAPPSSETGTREGIFDANLPSSLLGGDEIWIQARLRTVIDFNDARWSPTQIPTSGNVFEFKAATVPEPSSLIFSGLGLVLLARRHRAPRVKRDEFATV